MKKCLLILFIIASSASAAQAVKVANLYQVDMPVASQDDNLRATAEQLGLIEVIHHLSGDLNSDQQPKIKAGLEHAEQYVQEFSYEAAKSPANSYLLQVHYKPEDVNNLLRAAGISYLGENRPTVLIWLAYADTEHPSEVIGSEAHPEMAALVARLGNQSDLPVILPMMDVADVSQVSTGDVMEMAVPALKEASKRYPADALLIGSIRPGANGYLSEWQLVKGDKSWRWKIEETTAEKVIASVLVQVNQTLPQRYVAKPMDEQLLKLKLEVANIVHKNDLSGLQSYLKQLIPVRQVQLSQLNGEYVELILQVQGSVAAFKQHADIGGHLLFKSHDAMSNTLVYDWAH